MPQYQGVWTLEAQAQAQSNQQWVTDPNFKNTTLLLQADGTGSGSQNQTFLDGSTNNFFITRNGNTTQGSFSPFSQAPGYWGNYFDGTGDYLTATSNAAYQFGTGDFTIECWLFTTAYNGVGAKIVQYADDGNFSGGGYGLEMSSTAIMNWSGATLTSTAPANQWFHVAIVRSSGTLTAYINGASVYSAANSTNYNYAGTYPFSVGSGRNGAGNYNNGYTGYISNLRVIKGTAVYTAAFTPQTSPLTNITNTSLLTCQSNRFVDNSSNAFAITANGTPSVQAFGPFAPALQWTPDVVGGSGYFDGTSDYLSLASNANLTPASSTYTFECWVYRTASGAMTIWDTSVTNGFYIHINGSNKIVLRSYGTADIITSSSDAPVNAWFNLVVARGAANSTKMWINGSSTSGGSATDSTTYVAATTYIGIYDGSTVPLTGYIAGMRLVKGSDVYGVSNSTITVPTTPPTAITNTQLLLNYTNAGIYDGKMANNLETVGNAQVATSPVKYGSGSMYFDGSGDYLTAKNNPAFLFNTGDFTVELWYYPLALTGTPGLSQSFVGMWGTGNVSWLFYLNNGNLYWYTSTNGSTQTPTINAASGMVVNNWYHLALCRSSGTTRIFVNGVSIVSTTTSVNLFNATCPLTVGYNPVGGTADHVYGYIDDLRITNGVCRYIANFTPPQQALPRQ